MDASQQILTSKEPLLAALMVVVPIMAAVIFYLYRENQMLWNKITELQMARLAAVDRFLLEAKERD